VQPDATRAAEQRHDAVVHRAGGVPRRRADLQGPEAPADDRYQVGERTAGVDADQGGRQVSDFALEPADGLASAFDSALPPSDLALSLLPPSVFVSDEADVPPSSFLAAPPLPFRA
jgi:hypothetical protein